ncbi:MAG: ATP-binding cassette domain-containing protein [Candidatus Helarchaeota archaeon]
MSSSHKNAVEVSDLKKVYNLFSGQKLNALDSISFNLKRTEILGIVGQSGGGKTTLLRILRGVEPFNSGQFILRDKAGEILLRPDSPARLFREAKKKTVIHLQRSFGLWATTALDNVMRRLNALTTEDETAPLPDDYTIEYKEMKEKALEILDAVKLKHKAEQAAPVMSGGEKQRLVLARQLAIAGSTKNIGKILLIDEPVTMSDPLTKQISLDYIKNLRDKYELSIIVASHHPQLLRYLSDRVIWLENGKIVAEGEPQNILDKFLEKMAPVYPLEPLKIKKPLIRVKNISRKFYSPELLKLEFDMSNVNFEVFESEILGIIGPSGIGKTVLLELLSGVSLPKEGEILYDLIGKNVNIGVLGEDAMLTRRHISYVRQELSLTHNAIIRDLAAATLGIKGERALYNARKKAKELNIREEIVDVFLRLSDLPDAEVNIRLEKLGLDKSIIYDLFPIPPWSAIQEVVVPIFNEFDLPEKILYRKTQELSGGESIRVAIALGLLSSPRVIILDEPFGDLDPITLRNLANMVKKVNRMGVTIIIVSHHTEFLKEVTHRILYLKEGKVIKMGDPKDICDEFLKDSNAKFMS